MKNPNFHIFKSYKPIHFYNMRQKSIESGTKILLLCNITYFPTFFTFYLTQLMIYFYTSKEFEDLAGMKSVNGIHTIFYPLIEKPDTPLVWLFILSKTMYYFE